jgi:hypothetical protein
LLAQQTTNPLKSKSMKTRKLIVASFVLGIAFSFTSCKKDYTCTCTVDGFSYAYEFEKVKKADAEDACSSWETQYKIVDPAASRSLKKK